LDTSVFIAAETGRALDRASMPDQAYVSVITVAELTVGVLAASDTVTKASRLATLHALGPLEPLPVTAAAAAKWAELRVRLAEAGRRMNVNDLWIAAIAAANGLPIVTQDADFEPIEAVGGPQVILV
jgi:predicted nucleic acid-binding protein